MKDHDELLSRGRGIAWTATGAAFVLAVLKGSVGYTFNSPVLIADAFHSGSDIFINFASGFGLFLASRKRSERFPYGLYKAETLACLVISLLILFTGWEIFTEGLEKLRRLPETAAFPVFPVCTTVFSCLVSWAVARKMKRVGREVGSLSLSANAKEAMLDVYVSLVVTAGILLAYFRISYVEGAVIVLISLLIAKVGIENLWASVLVLLDANVNPGLKEEIEEQLRSINGVKGVGEVKVRQSGPFRMVECVIETRPSITMYKAHELADTVEKTVREGFDGIETVFVHTEPAAKSPVNVLVPVTEMDGLNSPVHHKFARAPFFAVLLIDGEKVELEDFYFNEFRTEKKHAGVKVVKAIVKYRVDKVLTPEIGEIAYNYLKQHYIEIHWIKAGTPLETVAAELIAGLVPPLTEPSAVETMEPSGAGEPQLDYQP